MVELLKNAFRSITTTILAQQKMVIKVFESKLKLPVKTPSVVEKQIFS